MIGRQDGRAAAFPSVLAQVRSGAASEHDEGRDHALARGAEPSNRRTRLSQANPDRPLFRGLRLSCAKISVVERLKAWDDRLGVATPRRSGERDRSPSGLAPWMSRIRPSFDAWPEQMMGSKSRMQGKAPSQQSVRTQVYLGIDVGKARLDVFIDPLGRRLAGTNNGRCETDQEGDTDRDVALMVSRRPGSLRWFFDFHDERVPGRRGQSGPLAQVRRRRRRARQNGCIIGGLPIVIERIRAALRETSKLLEKRGRADGVENRDASIRGSR